MRVTSNVPMSGHHSTEGLKPGSGETTRNVINAPRPESRTAGHKTRGSASTLAVQPAWRRLSQLKVRAGCPLQICRSPFAAVSTETAEAKLSGETRQVVHGYRSNIVQVRFGADPRYAALIVTSFL